MTFGVASAGTLNALLGGLASSIKHCEVELLTLEACFMNWLENRGNEKFDAISEIQRFDYLRQMLADFSSILLFVSEEASDGEGNGCVCPDMSCLLEDILLGENKNLLLNGGGLPKSTIEGAEQIDTDEASDFILFNERSIQT